MAKKTKTPLGIFTESIGLYFSNFDKFVKYMTFPVLGQIAGLGLVLALTIFYAKNIPNLVKNFPFLNDFSSLMLVAIILTLPGMIIFCKAFWEYLVAYGAVNSMLENMLKSGKVYDFDAHTELIKRRSFSFVGLWLLFGMFSLLALIPFFWVPCGVLAIFFVLVFQVFTYESESSPFDCIKRSLLLIKGHFASTFMLLVLVGALTYVLIPQLANMFFEFLKISSLLGSLITPVVEQLPISNLNDFLAYLYLPILKTDDIVYFTISTFIAQIFIQYTLPLRSILWGMWYKELNGGKFYVVSDDKPSKKRSSKKPSEKLMEASHKKYSSKKLDRNILKRAMEKDED